MDYGPGLWSDNSGRISAQCFGKCGRLELLNSNCALANVLGDLFVHTRNEPWKTEEVRTAMFEACSTIEWSNGERRERKEKIAGESGLRFQKSERENCVTTAALFTNIALHSQNICTAKYGQA